MTQPDRRQVMSPQTRAALGLSDAPRQRVPAPVGILPRDEGEVSSWPRPAPANLAGIAVAMRVQRTLALRTMATLIGGLLLVPLALLAPALRHARVAGIPVIWLLLGVAAYPVLLLMAHLHRRAVDRLEEALTARQSRSQR